MTPALEAIIDELRDSDRQERVDMLIDFAGNLPPLSPEQEARKDAEHRVEECQSPVFLFVEVADGRVSLSADAPAESPTVRGFVSVLLEGLDGATPEEILKVPADLVDRCGLVEVLGMLRVRGLTGVLRRIQREVARAVAALEVPPVA